MIRLLLSKIVLKLNELELDLTPSSPYLLEPLEKISPLLLSRMENPSPATILTTFLEMSSLPCLMSSLQGFTMLRFISPNPSWPCPPWPNVYN